MSELLHRTLGETIRSEIVLGGGLWPTFADANQLESAMLNLAVNARDAMPDGGRLTIETANSYLDEAYASRFGDLAPGQYVQVSVADSGAGMPPEMLDRVFEPFFTTKPVGQGSGLGLAMVHGFVKQSGGHVRIYSEVGHGTTVKIYLPRLTACRRGGGEPGGRAHGRFDCRARGRRRDDPRRRGQRRRARLRQIGASRSSATPCIEAGTAEDALRMRRRRRARRPAVHRRRPAGRCQRTPAQRQRR